MPARRRYRRTLPRLVSTLLYPDMVGIGAISDTLQFIAKDLSHTPPPLDTPEALDMGFWPEAVAGLGTVYHPPEIFAVRLRDVLVWPRHNLLLTNKRAVVRDSTSTVLPITLRGWTERLFAPIRDMAGVCFLFRGVHNNFYHTMIDNMARLYCLHLPPYTELTEIKLLLPTAPTALESFIFEQ